MTSPESVNENPLRRSFENVLSSRLTRRNLLRGVVNTATILALNEISVESAHAQGRPSESRGGETFKALTFGGAFIGGAIGASLNTREFGDGPAGRVILGLAGAVAGMFTGVAIAVATAR